MRLGGVVAPLAVCIWSFGGGGCAQGARCVRVLRDSLRTPAEGFWGVSYPRPLRLVHLRRPPHLAVDILRRGV